MFDQSQRALVAGAMISVFVVPAASAGMVAWTDWTVGALNSVSGTATLDNVDVGVTLVGGYDFVQLVGGTNFWLPAAPYLSASVDNVPPDADIVAFNAGGSVTINFSRAVVDPLIALVSWNSNVVEFGAPIEFLSFGAGYWGNGSPALNGSNTGFTGAGELHGVLRLVGTYTSINFTHTSENWHGLTVGFAGIDSAPVPLPGAAWLFGPVAVSILARRRASLTGSV